MILAAGERSPGWAHGAGSPSQSPLPQRRHQHVRAARCSPWGNHLGSQSASWSFPLGYRVSGALGCCGGLPHTAEVAFPAPARYLRLVFADGTTRRVPLVPGAGLGFAIVRLPARPAVLRWDVYRANGQRLTGGQGPPSGPYR